MLRQPGRVLFPNCRTRPQIRESRRLRSEIIRSVSETDPKEILREARRFVKSQQYAAALEKYVWFHDHALESNRALAGVRLSYAILEWVDLGDVYPAARKALESVRDAKSELLIQGTCDVGLFHDVASINRAFGQIDRTSDLFKTIAGADRGFAQKCFHVAIESLIRTKEFVVARSFVPDPRKEIDQFAIPLRFAQQPVRSVSPEMLGETLVQIYAKNVNLVLQVLLGVGEQEASDHLRDYALECVPDAQLRDSVMQHLYSSLPSTRIQ